MSPRRHRVQRHAEALLAALQDDDDLLALNGDDWEALDHLAPVIRRAHRWRDRSMTDDPAAWYRRMRRRMTKQQGEDES